MDSWMTIIASPMVVAVAGRIATWKVCCITLVVSTGNGVTDLPITDVHGTCWFERNRWIRRTRVWKLDRPVSQELLWKSSWWHEKTWGFSHVILHGCCCCSLLQSEVHVVGWISSRILRWPRSPVFLPSGMRIEASCRFHAVDSRHLGSWYHCLSYLQFPNCSEMG